ncbi:unnamed protein product [Mytilus edulis]|uniref:Uncharacterized protein n=1 Tax=Mytilus edulis TaxID=6550 RepID=A0A8S3Q919_MYTED|nr:unnamed protein product [Mytilus edulis]
MILFSVYSPVYVLSVLGISGAISIDEYLAVDNCDKYKQQSAVPLPTTGDPRCITVTKDNKRINDGRLLYTSFTDQLDFKDNTPRFCFDQSNKLVAFDASFDSNTPDEVATVEITPCREAGYWTNGNVFCNVPECSKYVEQTNTDYFEDELHVTVNMKDLFEIPVTGLGVTRGFNVIKFDGTPDHRLIYNTKTNLTKKLDSEKFKDYCSLYGPCVEGMFLGRSDLLYLKGGRPPLVFKRQGDEVFIVLRYDPRMFAFRDRPPYVSCYYTPDKTSEECDSPTGSFKWTKLWQSSLPYEKEWLSLRFFTRWSSKQDCIIRVTDTETGTDLVNFTGPCGRYADMDLGNFPYPRVGLFGKGINGSAKLRFKDLIFK